MDVPDDAEEMIEILRRLEAGTEPVRDIEDRLLNAVRATLRTSNDPAAGGTSLLRAAAELEAGDAARLALLTRIVPRFGERLLQAAQEVDAGVVRAIPGGRVRVASAEGFFVVQRDYEAADGSSRVLSAVVRREIRGAAGARNRPGRPVSVTAREEGLVFLRERPDEGPCLAWGPPAGPLQEDCAAEVHRGAVVVSAANSSPAARGANRAIWYGWTADRSPPK